MNGKGKQHVGADIAALNPPDDPELQRIARINALQSNIGTSNTERRVRSHSKVINLSDEEDSLHPSKHSRRSQDSDDDVSDDEKYLQQSNAKTDALSRAFRALSSRHIPKPPIHLYLNGRLTVNSETGVRQYLKTLELMRGIYAHHKIYDVLAERVSTDLNCRIPAPILRAIVEDRFVPLELLAFQNNLSPQLSNNATPDQVSTVIPHTLFSSIVQWSKSFTLWSRIVRYVYPLRALELDLFHQYILTEAGNFKPVSDGLQRVLSFEWVVRWTVQSGHQVPLSRVLLDKDTMTVFEDPHVAFTTSPFANFHNTYWNTIPTTRIQLRRTAALKPIRPLTPYHGKYLVIYQQTRSANVSYVSISTSILHHARNKGANMSTFVHIAFNHTQPSTVSNTNPTLLQ